MQIISGICSVFRREVKSIIHDRLYLASVVILPIIMLLFFVIMFSNGSIENLPVVVIDNDNSSLSRQIISMIDATPGVRIARQSQSVADANDAIHRGEVYGYIVIPDGFEHGIIGSTPTSVNTYISATNLSAAGVLRRDIQQAVKSFSSGVAITRLEASGVNPNQVMAEVMPINIHTHTIANPYMNYGYYLAPIFMIVGIIVFTVLSTIYAIGRELRYATASQWLSSAYDSLPVALIGKLLPTTIAMMIAMQLVMFITFVIMGMECLGSYAIITAASLLFIIAYQSIAVFIVSITANMRLALSLGGGYAVMAFTFSGITFPTIAMYPIARLLSYLFPLTYFSRVFIDQAMIGMDVCYDVDDMLWLIVFVLPIAMVWRRFSKVVRDNRYWGRD